MYPMDNLTIRSFDAKDSLDFIISTNDTYTKRLNYEYLGKADRRIQTTLGNSSNATELFYRKSGDDFNISATEILTKYKNRIYSINFTSKENRYGEFGLPEIINQTINNFRIIEFPDYNGLNSTKYGLVSEIKYPLGWEFYPNGAGFNIYTPLESKSDKLQEYLLLSVTSVNLGINLGNTMQSEMGFIINNIKSNFSNFILIDSNTTTLFNKPAYKVMYSV